MSTDHGGIEKMAGMSRKISFDEKDKFQHALKSPQESTKSRFNIKVKVHQSMNADF